MLLDLIFYFLMHSPFEQFEITPIFYLFKFLEAGGIPVTNFTVFSAVAFLILSLFLVLCTFDLRIIPSMRQFVVEYIYVFVLSVVKDNLGLKGTKYFPLFFSIFVFLLFANLFGLFPYSFTLTSHLVVAASLSFAFFLGTLIFGVKLHGMDVLSLFFPAGAPVALAPLLVPIELISFFSRPFSLSIRLFANMTAGHVLLKILTGFLLTVFGVLLDFDPAALLRIVGLDDLSLTFALSLGKISNFIYLGAFIPYEVNKFGDLVFNAQDLELVRVAMNTSQEAGFALFDSIVARKSMLLRAGTDQLYTAFFYVTSLDYVVVVLKVSLLLFVYFFTLFFPVFILICFVLLELFVAVLQAYVFLILVVVYLRDILFTH